MPEEDRARIEKLLAEAEENIQDLKDSIEMFRKMLK